MSEIRITSGGKENINAAAQLISDAFKYDPTTTYLLSALPPAQRDAYRPKFFTTIFTAAAANHATFEEAENWLSCGVILPPGRKYDNVRSLVPAGFLSALWTIGWVASWRLITEFSPQTAACKKKALKQGEDYYYIFCLGTRVEGRRKGLCSAIVRRYQERARADGASIYLEAATEYCWRLYEKLGFVTVGEFVIGKGRADADGLPHPGGPGFKLWGMVWRPEQNSL